MILENSLYMATLKNVECDTLQAKMLCDILPAKFLV